MSCVPVSFLLEDKALPFGQACFIGCSALLFIRITSIRSDHHVPKRCETESLPDTKHGGLIDVSVNVYDDVLCARILQNKCRIPVDVIVIVRVRQRINRRTINLWIETLT